MNEIDIIIDQVKKVVTFLQYIDSLQVIQSTLTVIKTISFLIIHSSCWINNKDLDPKDCWCYQQMGKCSWANHSQNINGL